MAEDTHRIQLDEAIKLVARARQDPRLELMGWQFGGEIVREILDQPGVTGIRAYLARTSEGEQTLVLVGTDAKGSDVAGGTLAEFAWPCPPYCDEDSPLFEP
jgi:hypothetical protein